MTSSPIISFSHFPFDLNIEDDQNKTFIFNLNAQPSNCSSSSSQTFFNNAESGIHRNNQEADHYQAPKELLLGSRVLYSPSCDRVRENTTSSFTIKKQDDHHKQLFPSSSQKNNPNYNIIETIRVCSDCNTTKTPLWRSGPRGPKSLCNACGIRQRKARRAAALAANGGTVPHQVSKLSTKTNNNNNNKKVIKFKVQQKEKKSKDNTNGSVLLPFKKRCNVIALPDKVDHQIGSNNSKLCFEDLSMILSENSAYNQRFFPQDEREAAILLMALSYGLVCRS
ncbi:hypothetical protein ACFE04_015010 [Oxalis oulophora]